MSLALESTSTSDLQRFGMIEAEVRQVVRPVVGYRGEPDQRICILRANAAFVVAADSRIQHAQGCVGVHRDGLAADVICRDR